MTPPCRNCHAAPPLNPWKRPEPSLLHLSKDEPPPTTSEECPARPYWADWLKLAQLEMQSFPWWVRSNFEKTLQEKSKAQGEPVLPFRLEVKQGTLDVNLIPAAFDFSFHANPGKLYASDHQVYIVPGPNALIRSQLEIVDNRIPLLMKGLMEFKDVRVGVGSSQLLNLQPEGVSVGNYGDLHFILKAGTGLKGALNFLEPPMTPQMPLGYDWPHGDENLDPLCLEGDEAQRKALECPPQTSWIYADPSDPRRDLLLTAMLPKELRNPQERLPKAFGLEDLLIRILRLVAAGKSKEPNPNPPVEMKQLLDLKNLQPGSSITLTLGELRDFFLPGVLDLGPSEAVVKLTVGKEHEIHLDISKLSLNLDPMDYPAKPTLEKQTADVCDWKNGGPYMERPPVRLQNGSIFAGSARKNRAGETIEPGIHAIYYPERKVLDLKANLALTLDGSFPVAKDTAGWANLLVETSLVFTDEGPKLVPRVTNVEILDLNLLQFTPPPAPGPSSKKKAKAPAEPPPLQDVSLRLTDDSRLQDPFTRSSYAGPPHAEFKISGMIRGKWVDFSGQVQIPRHPDGSYDFSAFLQTLDVKSLLLVGDGKGGLYNVDLDLKPVAKENGPVDNALNYTARFGVHRSSDKPEEVLDLEGGWLEFGNSKRACFDQWHISAAANALTISGSFLDGGKGSLPDLVLKDLGMEFKVDRLQVSEVGSNLRIPVFRIAANPQGSDKGFWRGPLSFQQAPDKNLEVYWDASGKQASVKGLDLFINLQGAGYGMLTPGAKKLIHPAAQSIGLDGHLQGDYSMSFLGNPKAWHGEGRLVLRGDSDGDIYPLDAQGRRAGPPFLRETRWAFGTISSVSEHRGYAWGNFHLSTILNLGAITSLSPEPGGPGSPPNVNGLGPYEFVWEMGHNNFPVSSQGLYNYYEDYIRTLCYQTPWCYELITKPRPKEEML